MSEYIVFTHNNKHYTFPRTLFAKFGYFSKIIPEHGETLNLPDEWNMGLVFDSLLKCEFDVSDEEYINLIIALDYLIPMDETLLNFYIDKLPKTIKPQTILNLQIPNKLKKLLIDVVYYDCYFDFIFENNKYSIGHKEYGYVYVSADEGIFELPGAYNEAICDFGLDIKKLELEIKWGSIRLYYNKKEYHLPFYRYTCYERQAIIGAFNFAKGLRNIANDYL